MAVSKEIKETISVTIDEVFKKMNSISWLERQKAMKEEAFKNTEKILYCFNILKEHVADEKNIWKWHIKIKVQVLSDIQKIKLKNHAKTSFLKTE